MLINTKIIITAPYNGGSAKGKTGRIVSLNGSTRVKLSFGRKPTYWVQLDDNQDFFSKKYMSLPIGSFETVDHSKEAS